MAGAGGFVGRALVPELSRAGYAVRRLARNPAALEPAGDEGGVEDVAFDLDEPAPPVAALSGVDTAFYLVHAMGAGAGFAERDRTYAERFAAAARAAGVRHVVYLGGLHPRTMPLSEHLRSRQEVGDILRTGCGALHVRAGIIIGRGSASFEIMRDLVRRLPVMVTPRWLRNSCQVIELGDAVAALVAAVDLPGGREVDLAGPEVLTYREMLLRLADLTGRRRPLIVDVPVLTPGLSAHWLRFVTSVSLPVAQALVQSLRHDALADGADLCAEAGIRPCGFDEAVRRAIAAAPSVTALAVQRSWDGPRYSLRQGFRISPGTPVDRRLLEAVESNLRRTTRLSTLGVLRWRDGDLHLGPWSLIRLGAAGWSAGDGGTVARTILGGSLAGTPGGRLVVHGRPRDGGVDVSLVGFTPRLGRTRLYTRLQEPLHRSLVERAVRRAVGARAPDRRPGGPPPMDRIIAGVPGPGVTPQHQETVA